MKRNWLTGHLPLIEAGQSSNHGLGKSCPGDTKGEARHPLGSRARVLLTSVFGPYARDDEYGSRTINPMELYHNQLTRWQGPYSIRMFSRSFGLMLIQVNIEAHCRLLDFPTLERFVEEIGTKTYDIIGISSIVTNLFKVRTMCDMIRKYQPAATIVIGGHIANLPRLSERVSADHIVAGDGVRWFRRFLGEDDSAPIKHIVAYTGHGHRIMGSALPIMEQRASAAVIPSVGCPMGCNFCATSAMFGGKGKFVDFYSTGAELYAIMSQLEERLQVREFTIKDENFLIHRSRALELLELIERNGKSWGFTLFSSANALRSFSIDELVRLGVARVWIGLEGQKSSYQKLKGVDTRELVRELQAHGIHVIASTIVGLEEHTLDNVNAEIEHAVSHRADFVQFMLYMPLPGTPLYAQHAAAGTLLGEAEAPLPDGHGQYRFAHAHPHIPRGQETGLLARAFQRDFEANGPSVLRTMETNLAGWLRYRDDPRPRIRSRHARKSSGIATLHAGALWAGMRWFSKNPAVRSRIGAVLDNIYREFGLAARIAAPMIGLVVLNRLRKEAALLSKGWQYEPPTFYETNTDESPKPAGKNEAPHKVAWLEIPRLAPIVEVVPQALTGQLL